MESNSPPSVVPYLVDMRTFYLDGVNPPPPPPRPTDKSRVDVLIVGSGPAGLCLATQLAGFHSINVRLVDKRSQRLEVGQADGVQCRSVEMFQALGFAERVVKEGHWISEMTFWSPAPDGTITRTKRTRDTEEELSEFPHVILSQARLHEFFLDTMKETGDLEPDYNLSFSSLRLLNSDAELYPVEVTLKRTDAGREEETEVVRAKYVVGCDGARSKVRSAVDLPLRGDYANQAWGVMDILAVTNFPDIRLKCAIHSAEHGNILNIPKDGGYMTRFYMKLDELAEGQRVSAKNITAEHLISVARKILHPYTLDVSEVVWWSVYEIGQRLADRFSDENERVFIMGDAAHQHSPKAGQGMNVSIADAFNLGWKLASVLHGHASPSLLSTYSTERQAVAQELIDFDRMWAKMFSQKPSKVAGDGGIDPAVFVEMFIKSGRFTAGTAVRYEPSMLTVKPSTPSDTTDGDGQAKANGDNVIRCRQELAKGLIIGMRFPSKQVVRLCDARPIQLGHAMPADGRWRIVLFAGDVRDGDRWRRLVDACHFLATSPRSPIVQATPAGQDIDSILEVLTVLDCPREDMDIDRLPEILWPRKGRFGLRDYNKVFCDVPSYNFGFGHIYRKLDIDSSRGCAVVVRPDQYVSLIVGMDEVDQIGRFFEPFMLPRRGDGQ